MQYRQFRCGGVTSCCHSLENLTLPLSCSVLVGLKGWAVGTKSTLMAACSVRWQQLSEAP